MPEGLPCTAEDYFDLVDMTAREQRHDKTGYMDGALSPVLERLGLSKKNWCTASAEFETVFSTFVGKKHSIDFARKILSKKWVNLQGNCLQILSTYTHGFLTQILSVQC